MTTIRFERLKEFEKEFERLKRKFRSLNDDLTRLEKIIALDPIGQSQHRAVLCRGERSAIIKARLNCQTLRNNSLRVIYRFENETMTALWIEIYHKADKANEDKARWQKYVD